MTIPPGTIAIPTADWTRFPDFWMCVINTEKPDGSIITNGAGAYVAANRNAIAAEMPGDWIWYVDDDHLWENNVLMRLLTRMYEQDLDVLGALYFARTAPFNPVVVMKEESGLYKPVLPLPKDEDTIEVDGVGSGGMLVRRRVFDRIDPPWFSYGITPDGRVGGEDLVFCDKVRAAGMRVHAALDIELGHIGVCEVWPGTQRDRIGVVIGGWGLDLFRSAIPRPEET